jgi:hypothetical protein
MTLILGAYLPEKRVSILITDGRVIDLDYSGLDVLHTGDVCVHGGAVVSERERKMDVSEKGFLTACAGDGRLLIWVREKLAKAGCYAEAIERYEKLVGGSLFDGFIGTAIAGPDGLYNKGGLLSEARDGKGAPYSVCANGCITEHLSEGEFPPRTADAASAEKTLSSLLAFGREMSGRCGGVNDRFAVGFASREGTEIFEARDALEYAKEIDGK